MWCVMVVVKIVMVGRVYVMLFIFLVSLQEDKEEIVYIDNEE